MEDGKTGRVGDAKSIEVVLAFDTHWAPLGHCQDVDPGGKLAAASGAFSA